MKVIGAFLFGIPTHSRHVVYLPTFKTKIKLETHAYTIPTYMTKCIPVIHNMMLPDIKFYKKYILYLFNFNSSHIKNMVFILGMYMYTIRLYA